MKREEYKESGVEWIGKIPARSQMKPLHTVASEVDERNIGGKIQNVQSLSYGKIVRRDVSTNFGLLPASFETHQIVRPGDIVLRLLDLQNDHVSLRSGLVPEDGIVTSAYVTIRPKNGLDSEYAANLLDAYDLKKVFYSFGGGCRQSMGFEDLKKLPLPYPPALEQRRIAQYIAKATGKIDRLMSLRRRQMELLREQRAALIQQAVTRGLNPRAPLKDSGLPWLGQIPKHWEVKKLGLLARIGNGSTPSRTETGYWTGGSYPWLNSSVVNQEGVTEAEELVTDRALRECHLPRVQPQSVLVGITGQGKTRGMARLLAFEATINQHIAYVTVRKPSLEPSYLLLVLKGMYQVLRLISEGEGSTKGALTCEDLTKLKIPLPPVDEQGEILAHIQCEAAKLDGLHRGYERQLALLAEYRASLIHECVTGQRPIC